jgi:hypothetical protein
MLESKDHQQTNIASAALDLTFAYGNRRTTVANVKSAPLAPLACLIRKWVAFPKGNATLSIGVGTKDCAMVELLFMAQAVRKPLQVMARRWYCRNLFRATRGKMHCSECTKA